MKVGVVGFYGDFNSGDEAMAAVCLTELSRQLPDSRIFTPCRPLVVPEDIDVRWQPLARPWKRKFQRERRLCEGRCGALVFGGGSVFSDNKGTDSLDLRCRRIRALRRRGVRVAAVGVGLGPLITKEGRAIARGLLEQFDAIVVRERTSLRVAADLGLGNASLGFDVAVLLEEIGLSRPTVPAPGHAGGKKSLGLAICNYSQNVGRGPEEDRLRLERIVRGLRSFDWAGWRLKLLVLSGHRRTGDLQVAAYLQTALRDTVECDIVHHHPNPLLMMRQVGLCDAVVSMRLHGAVYAYAAERPFGVLSYHQKCASFADMVGLPKSLVLDADDFAPEDLHRLLAQLVATPMEPGSLMPLVEARRLARLGIARVVETIDGERQ